MEEFKTKKVIVTGGSGQIGSHLRDLSSHNKIKFLFPDSKELNLSNELSILNYCDLIGPDLIINLGAYTNVDKAESEKNKASSINHLSVSYLAKYSYMNDIGIIHFSTDYVFGDKAGPHDHNSKKDPINYYGYTKKLAEDELIKSESKYLIIRLASVFCYRGRNFVKSISELILDGKDIKVVSDQKISLTYAGDVANLIIKLIDLYFLNNNFRFIKNKIIHYTNIGYTDWFSVACFIKSKINTIIQSKDSKISSILASEWDSEAKRPLDSRLVIDNEWLKDNGISVPAWEGRVKDVVSKILSNKMGLKKNED